MYKTINKLTPHYLHELFESRSTGYNLRNSGHTLFVPKPRTNYGKRNLVPRVPVFKGSGAHGGTLANSDCQVTK